MMNVSLDRFQPPDERVDIVGYCVYCGEPIERSHPVTSYASGAKTHDGFCEVQYVENELGITRSYV
ncbi:hypothetical protein [Paenibacillus sp. UASWS1643]|uniref:hypothetical protein n=1 Tax=Paenibacillus sp. UASWS1643 TaxID=2580422 RepID=UPI001238BE4C|nr:hypothetical protein [Paenibacillus sp. UASWS1643]KAA8750159.1 hypothetical protein FE296_16325 [Paenibacillus sp. UASWS1643]